MPKRVSYYKPPGSPTIAERRRESDQRRRDDAWRAFINSPAWRRCAKSYLRRNPICVRCIASDVLTGAVIVHHTRGQDERYKFDESTFEALCARCHSQHHASISGEEKQQHQHDNACTHDNELTGVYG
jgi:hypothetical protein